MYRKTILIVFSLFYLLVAGDNVRLYVLAHHGMTTRGVLTKVDCPPHGDSAACFVDFEYSVPGASATVTLFRGSDAVDETVSKNWIEGDRVTIVYLSSDPAYSAVKDNVVEKLSRAIIFWPFWITLGLCAMLGIGAAVEYDLNRARGRSDGNRTR